MIRTKLIGMVVLVLLPSALFGQKEDIPRTEYFSQFRAALEKSDSLSRRQLKQSRLVFEGKLTQEAWTSEYQLPDRVRYLHITDVGGKRWSTEQITIGKDQYCKKNDDPWILVTGLSSCIPGSARGVSGVISEVFGKQKTMLNGKTVTVYSWYITHKDTFSKSAATD